MNERHVGILGGSSLVGACLLPILRRENWRVFVFSRNQSPHVFEPYGKGVQRELTLAHGSAFLENGGEGDSELVPYWICLAPIWVLSSEYFDMLVSMGARRVVALSSTSRFTKDRSSDLQEQLVARRIAEGEESFAKWAEQHGMNWVILRPTLIYGRGQDKNISEIARFIRRFNFFPLLGEANGLRQPVHAEDVAATCASALEANILSGHAYNLSGGETLPYRQMVRQVFAALGRPPKLLTIPPWTFRFAVRCLRQLPRYRHWSFAMAERMNQDLVFDHEEATRDLGFSPRPFRPGPEDVPPTGFK